MRYNGSRLLPCPPKTASRYADLYVVGELWEGGDIDGRHAALHTLPASLRQGRDVYCLTRNPYDWYESWWAHMQRQPDFYWRDLFGFRGQCVPFAQALRAYCYGWRQPPESARGGSWYHTHLLEQARLGVGWFSFWMIWTSSDVQPVAFNPAVRWIRMDHPLGLDTALSAGGFVVRPGAHPEGAGDYARPVWTDEMRAWVDEMDGPTWKRILAG